MIVVADTSPLTALLTVGEAELLPRLFNEVVIPEAVRDELLPSHPLLPAWLHTRPVRNQVKLSRLALLVDAGEAAAIELAREIHADRLLIDERKGRRLALAEGVPVIGLVGAVLLAKRRQFIPSARALLHRLEEEAGIYLSEAVREVPSNLSASRHTRLLPVSRPITDTGDKGHPLMIALAGRMDRWAGRPGGGRRIG